MLITKKIMVFILMMAILIVIKEGINFFLILRDAMKNNTERKLEISTTRLVLLGCSISYILTIIFTGFSLF